MKSGRPLVLVVNHRGTVQHLGAAPRVGAAASSSARQRSHLRLVSVAGVRVAGASVAPLPVSGPAPQPLRVSVPRLEWRRAQRPRRSLSRPFARRVVQAASDVAVLALALLSGLRPLA